MIRLIYSKMLICVHLMPYGCILGIFDKFFINFAFNPQIK